jgi:hypothetical protein
MKIILEEKEYEHIDEEDLYKFKIGGVDFFVHSEDKPGGPVLTIHHRDGIFIGGKMCYYHVNADNELHIEIGEKTWDWNLFVSR